MIRNLTLLPLLLGLTAAACSAEPSAEEAYLHLFTEQRWRDAEASAMTELTKEPHAQRWCGYLAAAEYQLQRWGLVLQYLARQQMNGGMWDRNQLGMAWESAIRLEVYPFATEVFLEIRRRFPTSTLASFADGRQDSADAPTADEKERQLHRLWLRMQDGERMLAQHRELIEQMRVSFFEQRQNGLLCLAQIYGTSYLQAHNASAGETDTGMVIRLLMVDDAVVQGDLAFADQLLAVIPPDFHDGQATLTAARLARAHGDLRQATMLAQTIFDSTHNLAVKGSARQLLKDLRAQSRSTKAAP